MSPGVAEAEQRVRVLDQANGAFATAVQDRDVDQGGELVGNDLIAEEWVAFERIKVIIRAICVETCISFPCDDVPPNLGMINDQPDSVS